jgi:hypothetical protein
MTSMTRRRRIVALVCLSKSSGAYSTRRSAGFGFATGSMCWLSRTRKASLRARFSPAYASMWRRCSPAERGVSSRLSAIAALREPDSYAVRPPGYRQRHPHRRTTERPENLNRQDAKRANECRDTMSHLGALSVLAVPSPTARRRPSCACSPRNRRGCTGPACPVSCRTPPLVDRGDLVDELGGGSTLSVETSATV